MIFFLNLPAVVPPVTENLTFDFTGRVRFEGRENGDLNGASADDVDKLVSRFRFGVNLNTGESSKLRLVYQGNYLTVDPDGGPSVDTDQDMLVEGYLTTVNNGNRMTFGRQKVNKGDQRLIGALEWANTSRSWDAVRFEQGSWDFVYGRLAINPKTNYNVWLSLAAYQSGDCETMLINKYVKQGGPDTNHFTLTNRFTKSIGSGAALDVTSAFQFGTSGGRDHEAWAASAKATMPVSDKLGLFVEANTASGGSQEDDTSNTFDQLYPTGHKFNGYADFQGWSNVTALSAGLNYKASSKLGLRAAFHSFRLFDETDGWYGVSGGINKINGGNAIDPTGAAGKDIGTEIDLSLNYKINDSFSIQAGWSEFDPGSFVENLFNASPGNTVEGYAAKSRFLFLSVSLKY
jgi:hypothetical protein